METRRVSPRRRSYGERRVLAFLAAHPTGQISYDNMAVECDLDRRTLITIVARLRYRGQLEVIEPGRGCKPHRYKLNVA